MHSAGDIRNYGIRWRQTLDSAFGVRVIGMAPYPIVTAKAFTTVNKTADLADQETESRTHFGRHPKC